MSKKKGTGTPSWMCINPKKRFIRIYSDLLLSDAFQSLSHNQQLLYVYMSDCYIPTTKVEHPYNNASYFFFNRDLYQRKYGLYTNDRQFRKDRDELIKKGFIEEVESGKLTRTKSVYKFSDKWKTYNGEDLDLPAWRL